MAGVCIWLRLGQSGAEEFLTSVDWTDVSVVRPRPGPCLIAVDVELQCAS